MKAFYFIIVLLMSFPMLCFGQEKKLDIPVNQWVKIGECPGDILEREVPPGRGSSWVYNSDNRLFYRFGGFTPRYSNALTTYNPATKAWTELWADDENYPDTRPPGVAAPSMAYDAKAKKVWISGGFRSVETGKFGLWQYDVEADSFSFFKEISFGVRRIAYAFDRGVAVCSPSSGANGFPPNTVLILDLKTGEWIRKTSQQVPNEGYRGNYPIVYHQATQKMVVVTNFKDTLATYILDLDSYQWEKLDIQCPPGNNRTFYNLLYEPKSKMVFLFGGHNGSTASYYGDKLYYNDTWVFDIEKKEWKELKIHGPSTIKAKFRAIEYDVLTYSHAYDFDTFNECITFSDPDRGIWALKYDPKQPIASDLKAHEPIPIGQAIDFAKMSFKTPPQKDLKSNESLRVLPSGLNEKLLSLADNALIPLGGRVIGGEVAWAFSEKYGVFFKYGGCGNGSAPFWVGYGNDLSYYDPVDEKFYTRRVGDVSGADRPGTGCTRSIVWDSKRHLYWVLGGSSAGPYPPELPNKNPGVHAYDPLTDTISRRPQIGQNVSINGHHTYLNYDPGADIFVAPQAEGKTAHFICAESRWQIIDDTNSPGPLINYSRTVYISSKKKIFMIYPMETGNKAEKAPADWVDNKDAAGKRTTIWELDKKDNMHKEKILGTFMYDSASKKWQKLETKTSPMFRNVKYGLAYDPYNDIVFLVGGNIGWGGPIVNDMWAYHVQKNEWEKLNPEQGNAKILRDQCLMTDFDTRHNVLIFATGTGSSSIWAYRYKKGDWKPEK